MKQQEMNGYLANLAIMVFKLNNLHWNCVGKEFVQMHLYVEDVYKEILEYLDEVAEIQKMDGLTPDSTLKDYLAKATIKEVEAKAFSTAEVLGYLKDDLTTLKEQATALRNSLDEDGHFTGVALMEDHVASYRKRLWFIESMMK